MAHVEVIRGIPAERVDKVVAMFKADGATDVKVNQDPDGTFTITATFPD